MDARFRCPVHRHIPFECKREHEGGGEGSVRERAVGLSREMREGGGGLLQRQVYLRKAQEEVGPDRPSEPRNCVKKRKIALLGEFPHMSK